MARLLALWRLAWAWLSAPAFSRPPPAPVQPRPEPVARPEPAPPGFDAHRLVADLRAGDPAALERAFQITFDNDLGRLVLMQHLIECGVAGPFGADLDDGQLRYMAGRHDAALELASRVFDAPAIVAAVGKELKGSLQDETAQHLDTGPAGDGGYDWDEHDLG